MGITRLISTLLLAMADEKPVIHFNHAGASPSPSSVTNRMIQHLHDERQIGGYAAEAAVRDEIDQARENIANLVGSADTESIALVQSATDGWTRLFYSFCQYQNERFPKTPKIILISQADYAANVVAACRYANLNTDYTVLTIPSGIDERGHTTGKVDLEALQSMLEGSYEYDGGKQLKPEHIKLVCVTHIPTNSGIVNPVEEIGQEIFRKLNQQSINTIYLVDACQSIGQRVVNVDEIKCHGLVATGRKYIRGPRGTGFLYVAESICDHLWPDHVDHFSVPVTKVPSKFAVDLPLERQLSFQPRSGASKFSFWETNVAGFLGLGKAIDRLLEFGQSNIHSHITDDLVPFFCDLLEGMDNVETYYPPECGNVTFLVKNMRSEDVVERLWLAHDVPHRYTLSVVPATSTPIDSACTSIPNLVRASLSYTNTREEIELFCKDLSRL